MNLYSLLRPILFQLDAERAHHVALTGLQAASHAPASVSLAFGPPPQRPTTVGGISFRNPVGLAAGMDKNAVALPAWEALGFGFVEVGTITAKAQPGNPQPRLFRYPEQAALVNRMGFNNDGCDVVAARLERLKSSGRWPNIPVGINLGKSKVTAPEDAADDYLTSFRRLLPYGDYFVVNVSSPNTPGLRDLQHPDALRAIFARLRDHDATRPLFVKLAPDLTADQLTALAPLLQPDFVSGVIATNTTLDHSALPHGRDENGGLSGAPLTARAAAFLSQLRAETPLPVIASGGIMSGSDAWDRIAGGASLVQIYTGFVYRGPVLIREIVREIGQS